MHTGSQKRNYKAARYAWLAGEVLVLAAVAYAGYAVGSGTGHVRTLPGHVVVREVPAPHPAPCKVQGSPAGSVASGDAVRVNSQEFVCTDGVLVHVTGYGSKETPPRVPGIGHAPSYVRVVPWSARNAPQDSTLAGIAAHYHVPGGWPRLAALNHIENPSLVYPGEVVRLR